MVPERCTMAYMAYNQRSTIRIPGMESHHSILQELVDNMGRIVKESSDRTTRNRVLAEFLNYMEYHFFNEEDFIRRFGYPDFVAPYLDDREALKEEMGRLKQKLRDETFIVTHQTVLFVKNLLRGHMLSAEKYLVRRA
jgi:hemerythrin-like metal-binding protein